MCVLCACSIPQSCLTFYDLKDCSPPGSSLHGIFQIRILEWFAISFSRDLPDPGIKPVSPAWQVDSLPQSCSCFVLKCAAEHRNLKAGNHFKNHQTMFYLTYKIITEFQMDEMIHLSSAFLVAELNLKCRSSNSKLFLFFKWRWYSGCLKGPKVSGNQWNIRTKKIITSLHSKNALKWFLDHLFLSIIIKFLWSSNVIIQIPSTNNQFL